MRRPAGTDPRRGLLRPRRRARGLAAWVALAGLAGATAPAQSPVAPGEPGEPADASAAPAASAEAGPLAEPAAPVMPEPGAAPATTAPEQAAPEPPADPRAAALAQRDAAQQSFLRLIDEKRYEEAVTIAGQIVELTTRTSGEASIELASPLANLATAQMHTGDLAGAERNYNACIALIERAEGIASPRLINPLVGLGETYMRGGFAAQANEAYARALRVNHAAAGFYNPEQGKILDGLSESYLGLDKLNEANAQQRTQVAILRRRSAGDEELVAALYKLARWYNRTGQYAESRDAYQAARRLVRDTGGDADPAQVDALVGEALTYLNEGAVPASASTLKRALELLDAQPERDHLKRAEVLVALGDLYTVARQFRSARQRYGQAWDELSGDDTLLARREEYFAKPTIISAPRLPLAVTADGGRIDSRSAVPGEYASGVVLASLTVTADGDAANAVVIESEPPGLLDKDVLRALDGTAFRPRMEDGAGVATAAVQFRHDFRYPRSRAADGEPLPAPAGDTAGEKGERIGYPGEQDERGDQTP